MRVATLLATALLAAGCGGPADEPPATLPPPAPPAVERLAYHHEDHVRAGECFVVMCYDIPDAPRSRWLSTPASPGSSST